MSIPFTENYINRTDLLLFRRNKPGDIMSQPYIFPDEYKNYSNRFHNTRPKSKSIETSYLPIDSVKLYSKGAFDPLESFLQARQYNLSKSAEDLTKLIDQREKIKERNLYKISLGECNINSKLLNLENWYLGVNPVIDKRRAIFEKELLDFEKQKRMEETAAWKDILSLKGDLRQVVQDLYKEQSKQSLLHGGL